MPERRKSVPTLVGMTNPRSFEGKACQWCADPATQIVVVRPARFVNHEMVEAEITAATCATHAKLAEEAPDHPDARRRKHAKGYEQTSILDGDNGPQSAIFGDAA
jgi:hypothetical protein